MLWWGWQLLAWWIGYWLRRFRAIDLYNRSWNGKRQRHKCVCTIDCALLGVCQGVSRNLSGLSGFELHFRRGPWCLCRVFCMFLWCFQGFVWETTSLRKSIISFTGSSHKPLCEHFKSYPNSLLLFCHFLIFSLSPEWMTYTGSFDLVCALWPYALSSWR